MLRAVDFDNKLRRLASEINDVPSDRYLPPEPMAIDLL
jgi:hypothetical protein